MKKKKRVSFLLILFLFLGSNIALATSTTLEELTKKETQLKEQTETEQENQKVLKEELQHTKDTISQTEEQIWETQKSMANTEQQIITSEQNIESIEKEIDVLTKEIESLQEKMEESKALIKINLIRMSNDREVDFLEFLLRSENVSDFLYRYTTYQDILNKNEHIYDQTLQSHRLLQKKEEELKTKRTQLESERQELLRLKETLSQKEKEQQQLVLSLEEKEKEIEDDLEALENTLQLLFQEIQNTQESKQEEQRKIEEAKRKALEEAQKKALEETQKKEQDKQKEQNQEQDKNQNQSSSVQVNNYNSNGIFSMPLKSGTYRLSSNYGKRVHPVYKTVRYHNGYDFAANTGTPIYAVEEGYVLHSGSASGFGNWIVLKHPNGLHTVYGHMYSNQLYVKKGEYVLKGQHIAGVGSAGTSTGPHLHFEVRNANFQPLHPQQYLY